MHGLIAIAIATLFCNFRFLINHFKYSADDAINGIWLCIIAIASVIAIGY